MTTNDDLRLQIEALKQDLVANNKEPELMDLQDRYHKLQDQFTELLAENRHGAKLAQQITDLNESILDKDEVIK